MVFIKENKRLKELCISDEQLDYLEQDASVEELIELRERYLRGEINDVQEDEVRAREISQELKKCYERLNMGVLSEIDEIIKLTNELLELHL